MRTAAEQAPLAALLDGRAPLDAWLHQDEDGTPWACVSDDSDKGGGIGDTLRLHFAGDELASGRRPVARP